MVVIGVVYPGVEPFLKDSFNSLERQSRSDFDVLIGNDGLADLNQFLSESKLMWQSIDVNGSHSSCRRILIRKAIDMGYRKIVFADFDDEFEDNRIQVVAELLNESSIVVNDSSLIDLDGNEMTNRYFSQRYSESEMITAEHLRVGNMMGLSNTAALVDVMLENPATMSGDSFAFDWYFWASALLDGKTAKFTSKTATRYRIYGNNMAGLPQPLNMNTVRRGVEVKRKHYLLMKQLESSYEELAEDFQYISDMLKDDEWSSKYLSSLAEKSILNPIWWENIRSTKELNLI